MAKIGEFWRKNIKDGLNPDQQLAKKDDRKEGDLELKIAA